MPEIKGLFAYCQSLLTHWLPEMNTWLRFVAKGNNCFIINDICARESHVTFTMEMTNASVSFIHQN